MEIASFEGAAAVIADVEDEGLPDPNREDDEAPLAILVRVLEKAWGNLFSDKELIDWVRE